MKPYANLHTHSTHSDGHYTPERIVFEAKNEGYKAVAVTDHDTATGFPELKAACEAQGLETIFGVEFSVLVPDDFHILGFGFDPEYAPMKRYLADMALRQTDNTLNCFNLAVSKGDIRGISWQEVLDYNEGVAWICNNHVFRAMLAKGLVERKNYAEWFQKNFRNQRALFKPIIQHLPLADLVKLIKDCGGIALCAHPSQKQISMLPTLLECGIQGFEVMHPDLNEDERRNVYDMCIKHNLFIAGGSDHSGLCGGGYESYPSEEALKASYHYIAPLSAGTTEHHFRELLAQKINR